MSPEQQVSLQSDVDLGQRAQHVYDLYLEDFIKRLEQELYQSFLSSAPNPDDLLALKQLSMALGALKERVLSDIDGGKVALQQLSEATKN